MDVIVVVLSLILLVTIAYRGFSVILFAPVCALVAMSTCDFSLLPGYSELFMGKAVVYIKSFFPIFLLGAVFGKVMEETGMAASIARKVLSIMGKDKAILATAIACMILTYGGVSMFVCVFAIYPFASAMFREADIPKRLIPAVMVMGVFTLTMDCAPGSPQIQNIIPTVYLGTTTYAAPKLGLICGIILAVISYLYLEWKRKKALKNGEGYGNHTLNETIIEEGQELPPWYLSIIPLIIVLGLNFFLSLVVSWSPDLIEPFKEMNLPLVAKSVKSVISLWALILGLIAAIIVASATGFKYIPKRSSLKAALNAGAIGSLLAIMNTASEVGYGNVIAVTPGFTEIANVLLNVGADMPLVNAALMVNILAGITGSASGGMSIALEIFGQHWLEATAAMGIPPEVLHRVVAMASGGLDSMPHNGGVITILAVCGLTHFESYKDIFAITVFKIIVAFFAVFLYMATGIV
jgi:H+/gluconate symporter-like permease